MKRCLLALLLVAFAAQPAMAAVPQFFMDFDDDGVADGTIVSRKDLGFFEPATVYIGVSWADHCSPGSGIGLSGAEYQVDYTWDGFEVPPPVNAYNEPGSPVWGVTIGSLLNGGWFQSGPCRDACPEFIATLTVTGTGSPQWFTFAMTSAPYDFPDLFVAYDCDAIPRDACVMNNAAANADPLTPMACNPDTTGPALVGITPPSGGSYSDAPLLSSIQLNDPAGVNKLEYYQPEFIEKSGKKQGTWLNISLGSQIDSTDVDISWQFPVPIWSDNYFPEGRDTLYFRATDKKGNISGGVGGALSWVFVRDETPPSVVPGSVLITDITTGRTDRIKNGDDAQIAATITDNAIDLMTTSMIKANLTGLGGGASVSATMFDTGTGVATWAVPSVITSPGNGTVTVPVVHVEDAAGNVATEFDDDTIIADNNPPTWGTLTLKDLTSASTQYSDSLTVQVQMSGVSGADSMWVREDMLKGGMLSNFVPFEATSNFTFSEPPPKTFPSETRTVRVTLKDIAGNLSASDRTDGILIDVIPPTGAVASSPPTSNSVAFNVHWSPGDDDAGGSGISGEYELWFTELIKGKDGAVVPSSWQKYWTGSDTTVVFNGDNFTTYGFEAISIDNAGNKETRTESAETTTYIQSVAPTSPRNLTAGGSNPSPWQQSSDFLVEWDNPSADTFQIEGAYLKLGGGAPLSAADATDTIPGAQLDNTMVQYSPEGTALLWVWLFGNGGLHDPGFADSVRLRHDTGLPAFSNWATVPDAGSFNEDWQGDVVVQVTFTDTLSGVGGQTPQLSYKRGDLDAGFSAYADMTPIMGKVGRWGFSIPIPPDSVDEWHAISGQIISYKARGQDNAGNQLESTERELFVTRINQYPEVDDIKPAGVERNDPVPVRSIATDSDGHIERIEYSYTEGIPKAEADWISIGMDYSPENPYDYTFGGDRDLWLRARAYDGNDWGFWFIADTSFFLDNTPPQTFSDLSPVWHDTAFMVNLTRTDVGGSGFDTTGTTFYSTDGSNPTVEGTSFMIAQPGEYTVKYYSIDDAGNDESVNSDTARMDNSLPFGASASSPDTVFAINGEDTTHIMIEWTAGDDTYSGVSGNYRIGYKDDTFTRGDWEVLETSVSGTTYVFAPAEVGHVYRFEVGAIDLAGNQEPLYYGAGETRTYVKAAPDPPDSPAPTNAGGEEIPPGGTLGWDVDPMLTGHYYHVQVDGDSLFGSPEIDVDSIPGDVPKVPYSVVLDSLEGYDDLVDDSYYFWRVSVTDKYGQNSGFSDPLMFFFNKANSAPLAVTSGFMPAMGTVVTDTLVISWDAASDPDLSDPDSTLFYAVYLDDDGEFTVDYAFMYMTKQGDTSVIVPDSLTENAQWFYSLVTMDDDSASSMMSDTQNFYVNMMNSSPGAFMWTFPAPGDTLVLSEDTLRLRWEAAFDPDPFDTVRYRLRYGTDPNFGRDTCTVDTIIYGTSYLIDDVPCFGDPWPNTVYWKVNAIDLLGSSTAGTGGTWDFTVDPGTDVVLMAFAGEDVEGSAVLKWRVADSDEPLDFDVYRSSDASRSRYVKLEGEPVQGVDGAYVFVDISVEPGRKYSYKLGITEGSGPQMLFGPVEVVISRISGDAVLVWNYPNPFNPSTTITYHVPKSEVSSAVAVSLKIYDVSGKLIRTLVDDLRVPGYHSITWNGVDAYGEPAGSGVYYYVLNAGGTSVTKRMVLLK